MPTQGTQVYWHDLPDKKPPWKDNAELRSLIQVSQQQERQFATHASHTSWAAASGVPATLSRNHTRKKLLPELVRRRYEEKLQRRRVAQRLEKPSIYRGVVPEPFATPLRVMNVMMLHLGQRPVSAAEAEEAVDGVVQHYETLTQQSQAPSQSQDARRSRRGTNGSHADADGAEADEANAAAAGAARRPARRIRVHDPVAAALESVLSQTQHYDVDNEGMGVLSPSPPASQKPKAARHAAIRTDVQDSLLLNVLATLCESRALRFKKLLRADLSAMKWQITSVEAIPHERIVVLADRRDPYFVVLFGVESGVHPEPFAEAMLRVDGRSPDSVKRYRATKTLYTQLFCMTPSPVPWRKLCKNICISAFRNEFVVAVVERNVEARGAPAATTGAASDPFTRFSDPATGDSALRGRETHRRGPSSSKTDSYKRPRNVTLLLGADAEDLEAEADLVHPTPIPPTRNALPATSNVHEAGKAMEAQWVRGTPMFEEDVPELSGLNSHDMADAQGDTATAAAFTQQGQDPLQRLPRTDTRDHMANAKQRVWYRRLLPRKLESELMLRLRSLHED